MATNFVSYQTFSLKAKVSQDPLDQFSQALHHMVDIELQMINPTCFFRYLIIIIIIIIVIITKLVTHVKSCWYGMWKSTVGRWRLD